jgi:hypothetical protein
VRPSGAQFRKPLPGNPFKNSFSTRKQLHQGVSSVIQASARTHFGISGEISNEPNSAQKARCRSPGRSLKPRTGRKVLKIIRRAPGKKVRKSLSRRPSFHNSLKSSPELRLQYHNETAIDMFIYIKLV